MPLLLTFHSLLDALVHSVFITSVAVSLFTPTIVHDLGFSATNAQLLSVPPFLLAGLSTYIVSAWSDRVNLRGPFLATGAMVSMIGYIIAYTTSKPGPGYTAAIIAACGSFPCIAISLAWAGGNAGGNMKRGIVLAVVGGVGNIGGCTFLLRRRGVGTHSSNVTLHGTVIGCLGTRYVLARHRHEEELRCHSALGSIVCSCVLMWTYKRLNKEEEQCAREGIHESMKDMYRDLADKSPLFR